MFVLVFRVGYMVDDFGALGLKGDVRGVIILRLALVELLNTSRFNGI